MVHDEVAVTGDRRPQSYVWLWSVEECALGLRMSVGTLRNLGKLGPPKVRLGGKVWYRPASVLAWLAAREERG